MLNIRKPTYVAFTDQYVISVMFTKPENYTVNNSKGLLDMLNCCGNLVVRAHACEVLGWILDPIKPMTFNLSSI